LNQTADILSKYLFLLIFYEISVALGSMLKPTPVRALKDNYIWLIHGRDTGRVAIVDPGEAAPVIAALERGGLRPEAILVTHRHWDHVDGFEDLRRQF
jgi:hydroxyacylglutathione hydrolase